MFNRTGAPASAFRRNNGAVALPLVMSHLGFASVTEVLIQLLRWPALLALVILGLAVIYRFAPSRREPRWQWISVGSVIAGIAWLGSSALLSWYLSSFANYDATYGSLGAAIGMMMWMWISSIVILFGAQLNSEIEHQTARDSTVEHDKPLGTPRRHHGGYGRGSGVISDSYPAYNACAKKFSKAWRRAARRQNARHIRLLGRREDCF